MSNFHADDLLKSTPDAQSAISLIKAVTKMCKGSGFKLGKFISNNTVVLKSLQEDQRRKGVKVADLSSGELPVERALGVQWDIAGVDTGCFRHQYTNFGHTNLDVSKFNLKKN